MSNYCVTFRIADRTVNGKTYDERYTEMIDNVAKEDVGYWTETTSFFLVVSDLDTTSFTLRASDSLSAKHDLLFAFDPSDMSAAYFGALEHADVLRSFFPSLKKVG